MATEYLLQMDTISKEYYGNRVLKNVSLNVKPGEIHALLGENGAGKSTLMNILFGMPVIHTTGGFSGTVRISGEDVNLTTPDAALNAGIGMVHQEFMLIPSFSITENIKIGRELSTPTVASRLLKSKALEKLDMSAMSKDANTALENVGLGIEEYVRIEGLPIGYQQFVEIAREIDKTGIKLLVFDEPTAVLTESEAEQLMDVMLKIAHRGISIIFITHRLEEVMKVADTITVLRDGELAGVRDQNETTVRELAALMIGREFAERVTDGDDRGLSDERIALRLRDYSVEMPGEMVHGVDLDVREGEIFGIGGLAGQGKIGVPNGVMGLYPATGSIEVFGEPLDVTKFGEALRMNIAFVSEDRRGVGLLLSQSIKMNIAFNAIQTQERFLTKLGPFMLEDSAAITKHAKDMIEKLDIRCTGPDQPVGSLSGGNQQKVCLARALTIQPKLLFVSEPTRGIDIGAKKLVLDELVRLNREEGITIVMVSSELLELQSICDRIGIITDGKINAILPPDADPVSFGLAMSGEKILAEENHG